MQGLYSGENDGTMVRPWKVGALTVGDELTLRLTVEHGLCKDGRETTISGSTFLAWHLFCLGTPPFWPPLGHPKLGMLVSWLVVIYQWRNADNFPHSSATATIWLHVFELTHWGNCASHKNCLWRNQVGKCRGQKLDTPCSWIWTGGTLKSTLLIQQFLCFVPHCLQHIYLDSDLLFHFQQEKCWYGMYCWQNWGSKKRLRV